MRTSIEIDENLFYEVKKLSLDSKKSFGTIIEDALRTMMVKKNKTNLRKKVSLITYGGDGLSHGVDLDSNKLLLDIMDD